MRHTRSRRRDMKTTLMTFLRVAGSIGAAILVSWSLTRSLCAVVSKYQVREIQVWGQDWVCKAVKAVMVQRSRKEDMYLKGQIILLGQP
jgi:hypothetical protein